MLTRCLLVVLWGLAVAHASAGEPFCDLTDEVAGMPTPLAAAADEGFFYVGHAASVSVLDKRTRAVRSMEVPAEVKGIGVRDGLLYVSLGSDRLWTIDATDPNEMAVLSDIAAPAGKVVVTEGDEPAVLVYTNQIMRSYTLSEPATPALADTLTLAGMRGVAVRGSIAYAASASSGLYVIDASDPGDVALRGVFIAYTDHSPIPAQVRSVSVNGDWAYLGIVHPPMPGGGAVWTLDVSRPLVPSLAGAAEAGTNDVVADGDRVYARPSQSSAEFTVYDGSEPTALEIAYTIADPRPAAFWVSDGLILGRSSASPVFLLADGACEDPCPADLASPEGVVDVFDLLAFADAYLEGDPGADFAGPFGVIDVFDLLAFLDLYALGCEGNR